MPDPALGVGRLVCVTGATGYIGGRLVPELLESGYRVRALTRRPEVLADRPWAGRIEIAQADAADEDAVTRALQGVDAVYYLIHSLGTGSRFAERDWRTAQSFAAAARKAGVRRIIYLGGMSPEGVELSTHLASRREVGELLLAGAVPAIVLQAAVIIGSGSASFEMMRYLTERLPAMVAPKWLRTKIQPIAVRDVLRYLVLAARVPDEINRAFDVGGPDVLTYQQMMQRYARVAGLPRRLIVTLPVLTPGLASLWVGLVTPVPSGLARPLVESLAHEVVAGDRDIDKIIPPPPDGLIGFDRAVDLALQRVRDYGVTTSWSSASAPTAPSDALPEDPDWAGGDLYVDERSRIVDASREELWQVIEAIGGETGWFSWRTGWAIRGLIDRVIGGPGLRRGRRNPTKLMVGDAVDWWRVERLERGHLLRLRAEMRLPGEAWLELIADTDDQSRTIFRQRALYHPHGALGHLYWLTIKPFHGIVFGGMQRNLAARAAAGPRATRRGHNKPESVE